MEEEQLPLPVAPQSVKPPQKKLLADIFRKFFLSSHPLLE